MPNGKEEEEVEERGGKGGVVSRRFSFECSVTFWYPRKVVIQRIVKV